MVKEKFCWQPPGNQDYNIHILGGTNIHTENIHIPHPVSNQYVWIRWWWFQRSSLLKVVYSFWLDSLDVLVGFVSSTPPPPPKINMEPAKNSPLKRKIIWTKPSFLGFHVNFQGCISNHLLTWGCQPSKVHFVWLIKEKKTTRIGKFNEWIREKMAR